MKYVFAILAGLMLALGNGCASMGHWGSVRKDDRIPVILDTDIGNDIDDTWALMMLLKSPRFDVKLVTTTDGQPEYRGRLLAKLLTAAGRTDVPIALGPDAGKTKGEERETSWLAGYQLSDYKGGLSRDAAGAISYVVHRSRKPVTIIAIGPLQTLAATLERDPSVAPNARLVGMQGSVFKGYNGSGQADAEFNVKEAVGAAQKVLSAPWRSVAITPLDTCGVPGMKIWGEQFHMLKESKDPMVRAILGSYASWAHGKEELKKSTTLYDTVAIYLADPKNRGLLQVKPLKIEVNGEGRTVVSEEGRMMDVATGWNDLGGYRRYLVKVLLEK
ncbi:MAG TPA: nucleoside hydrolase [Tepidisphaeraceae bacterium]|jgi:inosine-uridine nucleoside N-ribohydrolase|nr:nucleoside hydrolase [Tepidisphaeraceae bacterium]